MLPHLEAPERDEPDVHDDVDAAREAVERRPDGHGRAAGDDALVGVGDGVERVDGARQEARRRDEDGGAAGRAERRAGAERLAVDARRRRRCPGRGSGRRSRTGRRRTARRPARPVPRSVASTPVRAESPGAAEVAEAAERQPKPAERPEPRPRPERDLAAGDAREADVVGERGDRERAGVERGLGAERALVPRRRRAVVAGERARAERDVLGRAEAEVERLPRRRGPAGRTRRRAAGRTPRRPRGRRGRRPSGGASRRRRRGRGRAPRPTSAAERAAPAVGQVRRAAEQADLEAGVRARAGSRSAPPSNSNRSSAEPNAGGGGWALGRRACDEHERGDPPRRPAIRKPAIRDGRCAARRGGHRAGHRRAADGAAKLDPPVAAPAHGRRREGFAGRRTRVRPAVVAPSDRRSTNQSRAVGPDSRLPLFPLGLVLLPGEPVPLHIFEPRYKEMVRVCLDGDRPFGIVYASPVGARAGRLHGPHPQRRDALRRRPAGHRGRRRGPLPRRRRPPRPDLPHGGRDAGRGRRGGRPPARCGSAWSRAT